MEAFADGCKDGNEASFGTVIELADYKCAINRVAGDAEAILRGRRGREDRDARPSQGRPRFPATPGQGTERYARLAAGSGSRATRITAEATWRLSLAISTHGLVAMLKLIRCRSLTIASNAEAMRQVAGRIYHSRGKRAWTKGIVLRLG